MPWRVCNCAVRASGGAVSVDTLQLSVDFVLLQRILGTLHVQQSQVQLSVSFAQTQLFVFCGLIS